MSFSIKNQWHWFLGVSEWHFINHCGICEIFFLTWCRVLHLIPFKRFEHIGPNVILVYKAEQVCLQLCRLRNQWHWIDIPKGRIRVYQIFLNLAMVMEGRGRRSFLLGFLYSGGNMVTVFSNVLSLSFLKTKIQAKYRNWRHLKSPFAFHILQNSQQKSILFVNRTLSRDHQWSDYWNSSSLTHHFS